MRSYPHDEFDDVPENSARRGAYRGRALKSDVSHKGFYAILCAGALALLIGAVMFIFQPRTLSPEASSAGSSTSSETASATATAREAKDPSELTVEIYNGGAYPGAAAEVKKDLENQGYTVSTVENWQGTALSASMVYYADNNVNEATDLADELGVEYIDRDNEAQADLYVVLGPDFTGLDSASSSATPTDVRTSGAAG